MIERVKEGKAEIQIQTNRQVFLILKKQQQTVMSSHTEKNGRNWLTNITSKISKRKYFMRNNVSGPEQDAT